MMAMVVIIGAGDDVDDGDGCDGKETKMSEILVTCQ